MLLNVLSQSMLTLLPLMVVSISVASLALLIAMSLVSAPHPRRVRQTVRR